MNQGLDDFLFFQPYQQDAFEMTSTCLGWVGTSPKPIAIFDIWRDEYPVHILGFSSVPGFLRAAKW
jgi:hypothetical protein